MPLPCASEQLDSGIACGALADESRLTFVQRLFRNGIHRNLGKLTHGNLRVRDALGEHIFGQGGSDVVEVAVEDLRTYNAIGTRGTLGAAEAYVEGWWTCDDLVGLFRLLTRNASAMAALDGGLARWIAPLLAWPLRLRRNTVSRCRDNIRAHYDLGNEFFALFLDETMAYSSAIFPTPDASLAEGSYEKFDRICRMLQLSPRDHVLEIGTGWGGFAVHAARHYGCRVTTTTISPSQYAFAKGRARTCGLAERVSVLCKDYRDLEGSYDKVVSIEMIEAVGHGFLDSFLGQCARLLRSDGAMLLQSITIPDQRYDVYRKSIDFIQKYIFPGGCIPSVSALAASIRRATDFRWIAMNDFGMHYAETLRQWRERFWLRAEAIRRLGFEERFLRMWHYYFCYCEAGFRDHQIGVAQILLAKPGCPATANVRGER